MQRVAILAVTALALAVPRPAGAQSLVVDHTSIPQFFQIPDNYLSAAANMTMMFVDRSVGANTNDGLSCLAYASSAVAPAYCKVYQHPAPEFSVPQSEVTWTRAYSRPNWSYFGWQASQIPPELSCGVTSTSLWWQELQCFINWVDANPGLYRVLSFQFSYLETADGSDIMSPTQGFFVAQPNRPDVTDLQALIDRHPESIFVLETANLARSNGSDISTAFNTAMRSYAAAHGLPLYDVADIESHDVSANPCYDNRDGVAYIINGTVRENYPDDGKNNPAICQQYTSEADGGHLGAPSAGMIRLAKAWWVLMARLAGWTPSGTSGPVRPPSNVRVIVG